MTDKFAAQMVCCVCGARLPVLENRQAYLDKHCACIMPDGSMRYYCPGTRHTSEEIEDAISGSSKVHDRPDPQRAATTSLMFACHFLFVKQKLPNCTFMSYCFANYFTSERPGLIIHTCMDYCF